MNKRVEVWPTTIQSCNPTFSIINLSGKTWETLPNGFFPPVEANKNAAFHKCGMTWLSLVGQSNKFRKWRLYDGWGELLTTQHICSRGNRRCQRYCKSMASLPRLLWLIPLGELKVTKNEEVMQELYYSFNFISHLASKTLTSVFSLLLFLLLMSGQTCSFSIIVSGLFTWLLQDGFPNWTWLSLHLTLVY